MLKFASAIFNWLARPSGCKRAVEIDLRLDVRYAFPRSLFIYGQPTCRMPGMDCNSILRFFRAEVDWRLSLDALPRAASCRAKESALR